MNINPTSFIEIHQQVRGVGDKYWLFYFFYLEIKATIGGSSEARWG
jgi:hypothetical protein